MTGSSGDEPLTRLQTLLQWIRTAVTFLVSHIGLCGLVVGYSFVGGLTFRLLEAPEERKMKTQMRLKEWNVTVFLWNQTYGTDVLHRVNWTDMATRVLRDFQNDLVDAVRKQGYDGSEPDNLQWTLPGAILYSIIVITTIGYGNIAPKTDWGKIVTIIYAIVGIPLMLLCMSNIGDVMAHSFKFIYWKVCCYFCARPNKRPRRTRSSVRSNRKGNYPSVRSRPGSRRHPYAFSDGVRPPSNTTSRTSSYRSGRSNPEDDMYYEAPHEEFATYGGGGAQNRPPPPPSNNPWPEVQQQHQPPQPSGGSGGGGGGGGEGYGPEMRRPPNAMNSKYGPESGEDLRVDLLSPGIERKGSSRYSSGRSNRRGPPPGPVKEDYNVMDEGLEDVEERSDDEDEEDGEVSPDRPVPIWLCVALVSGYLCGGAAIFRFWEDWEFFDSFYFCFITLTTIGFGDFVPGNTVTENSQVTLSLCAVYLLFGMALLAMSFNLVQEQVASSVKSLGKRIGIIGDEEGGD